MIFTDVCWRGVLSEFKWCLMPDARCLMLDVRGGTHRSPDIGHRANYLNKSFHSLSIFHTFPTWTTSS